ncbi:hypothetical protein GSF70_00235 [Flavobacteriaceae bacterium W22]|nr:hypothetical protein [Flavobacteriaceae bacterium W22]
MKNITIIVAACILISVMNCKAQQFPLDADFEAIPANSHLKDYNNELNQFVGTYKAIYQGNETTLYITKVEDKLVKIPNKSYYTDAVVIRYTVKNSSGAVLQDTQNSTQSDFCSISSFPQENAVVLHYPGTNCGVGWGRVFLFKINPTQLSWEYRPNGKLLDEYNCPGNQDLTVYLPVTKDLIFTKQ